MERFSMKNKEKEIFDAIRALCDKAASKERLKAAIAGRKRKKSATEYIMVVDTPKKES